MMSVAGTADSIVAVMMWRDITVIGIKQTKSRVFQKRDRLRQPSILEHIKANYTSFHSLGNIDRPYISLTTSTTIFPFALPVFNFSKAFGASSNGNF